MKNQIFRKILVSFAIFCFFNVAYADTIIHLDIKTPKNILYNKDITVTPCDSDNDITTPEITTAYCAILQSEIQNDWSWDWAPGAFLNSLSGISGFTSKDKDNNDIYHYWSWSLNGIEGIVGLNQYELQLNDLILLDFIDPNPTPSPSGNNGMGGGGGALAAIISSSSTTPSFTVPIILPAIKANFDLKKAFEFLISQQKENGSFGEAIYTDWTALALASGNYQEQTIKLVKYLGDSETINPSLTDYERHAMALMSLGLNPYNIYPTGVRASRENYIEKIIASFDGTQFGNVNEDNDDIFALIVLQNAGYTQDEKMISSDISFILNRQKENGSWDESIDMTGATIESLSAFFLAPGVRESLEKAKEFLKKNQKDNGGWNNASSTAWAIEGILALGEKPEDWVKNNNTPFDYLATLQDADGGMNNGYLQNKIWETAYVVSALSGKTWNQIMQKFEKPKTLAIVAVTEIAVKNPKKIIKKEMLTATAINAITAPVAPIQTEQIKTPKKSWFVRFIDSIFSIF